MSKPVKTWCLECEEFDWCDMRAGEPLCLECHAEFGWISPYEDADEIRAELDAEKK